eukprot:SAG11_NODE_1081_length_5956_cov_14.482506_6_plen_133_part_00
MLNAARARLERDGALSAAVADEISARVQAAADGPAPGLAALRKEVAVAQLGPCQALTTLDCWLLMWADSWAQATGGMVAASLGQLVEAYGGAAGSQTFFVSLFSVANCRHDHSFPHRCATFSYTGASLCCSN